MTLDFAAAMRRATDATRAADPIAATRIIQEALHGRAPADRAVDVEPPSTGPAPNRLRLDLAATDAEIVAPPGGRSRSDAADLPLRSTPAPRLRRSLADTINLLRKGRASFSRLRAPEGHRPRPEMPLPDGARFLARSHSGPHGGRSYRLYVPASASAGAAGLVVMLHGCTQTPEDFAAGTGMNDLAEAHRLLVAYPGQATRDNANACWNWFRPQDQDRGRGEPAIIAGITREIAGEFNVPDNRIFIAGLSAGGAMAAVLGETYPDLFAAVGVHSGLATGLASDVASAFAAMRGGRTGPGRTGPAPTRGPDAPRLIVFHGTADTTVHPENAVRIAQLRAGTAPDPVPGDPADPRRPTTRHIQHGPDGQPRTELWMIEGAGHAWSGGRSAGSYTDPEGPDASAAMIRFFLADR